MRATAGPGGFVAAAVVPPAGKEGEGENPRAVMVLFMVSVCFAN